MGLLESALYRPRTGYYNDLIEMVAALFESLMNNHPFIDGNKPVAFFSTDVFLRLNGYKMNVESRAAHAFLIKLFDEPSILIEKMDDYIGSVAINNHSRLTGFTSPKGNLVASKRC